MTVRTRHRAFGDERRAVRYPRHDSAAEPDGEASGAGVATHGAEIDAQVGGGVAVRDNLLDRIAEAAREGWLGEVEGLKVSLAGAGWKLVQIGRRSRTSTVADLESLTSPSP
ncbi:hypothetical protein ACFC1R_31040 [Kitasatospora sp. NPDC056138]|uniref:hypothetical protein n=1 Tax=Kitasatospora sp. NPDC056138 TaxID=3345724 RepID=UPI0035DD99B8